MRHGWERERAWGGGIMMRKMDGMGVRLFNIFLGSNRVTGYAMALVSYAGRISIPVKGAKVLWHIIAPNSTPASLAASARETVQ